MIEKGIQKLVNGFDLTNREAKESMKDIMLGKSTDSQIAAFLTSLRMKGETVSEISAFGTVMKDFCCRIFPKVSGRIVDTCGTGGDKIKTFNISTAAAFIVAGAGITVAKHGNRSVTSKTGSADLLEKLGLNLNMTPKNVEKTIEEVGIGFMFAPRFHPAMKYAIGPRRQIRIRTVFNILGPLTNPAGANAQVLGVYSEELLQPLAKVLKNLGCEEAMVVHGLDGLDEISMVGKTSISWLKNSQISFMNIKPKDFGFKKVEPKEIRGSTPEESAELTFRLLYDTLDNLDPRRNTVILNAAAGIIVGGGAEDFSRGIEKATESIESGAAYDKLKRMIENSNGKTSRLEELEKKYV